jgi:2-methylcitrate dehydratase PrpD
VRAETIAKVRVRVPPAYAGMIATRAEPGARQSTMVSVTHQIALAALDAERLYDVDRSTAKADADVAQFAAKVEIIADARLDAYYPQHWPAEVDVEAGGEVHQQRIVEAIGDPEHPLDHAGIVTKAHRVLDPLLGNHDAAEWLEMAGAALDDAAACRKLAVAFVAGL